MRARIGNIIPDKDTARVVSVEALCKNVNDYRAFYSSAADLGGNSMISERAEDVSVLFGSVALACPDYARDVLKYNVYAKAYDPLDDKAQWDELRQKWDADRTAAGQRPLSSISNSGSSP